MKTNKQKLWESLFFFFFHKSNLASFLTIFINPALGLFYLYRCRYVWSYFFCHISLFLSFAGFMLKMIVNILLKFVRQLTIWPIFLPLFDSPANNGWWLVITAPFLHWPFFAIFISKYILFSSEINIFLNKMTFLKYLHWKTCLAGKVTVEKTYFYESIVLILISFKLKFANKQLSLTFTNMFYVFGT